MHLHSDFSVDADDTVEAMCNKAVELNLKGICFTEHMDMNPEDPAYDYFDLGLYLETMEKIKNKYKDKLMVMGGVEFSRPHFHPETGEVLENSKVDVILASIHWLDRIMFGDEKLTQKYTSNQVFKKYYKEMKKMVEYGEFDVLAHLDFPKRYVEEEIPVVKYQKLIRKILNLLIKKDIVLEINTSTLRKGFNDCMPASEILAWYAELGGKKVTLGSDAHRIGEITSNFDYALKMVDKYNFEYGYFNDRNFVKLN